jgi:hypothetical protein
LQGKLFAQREQAVMQMMSNPDALNDNMKRQFVFIIQQSAMFGYVSYFFSGFIMGAAIMSASLPTRAYVCAQPSSPFRFLCDSSHFSKCALACANVPVCSRLRTLAWHRFAHARRVVGQQRLLVSALPRLHE